MRTKKRLLLVLILITIISVISLVALAAYIMTPKGYDKGEGPEAVAYNYLFSLVKKDFSSAYGLLSMDLGNSPDSIEAFVDDLERGELLPLYENQPCVYVEEVDEGGPRAVVSLRMQYYDRCWRLDVGTSNLSFNLVTIRLEEQGDGWKVIARLDQG
jgi:hypothetical protein